MKDFLEPDREWLARQPRMNSWETGRQMLRKQLSIWVADYTVAVLNRRVAPDDPQESEYAERIWWSWRHHWLGEIEVRSSRRTSDAGAAIMPIVIDGLDVAERVRAGRGIDNASLGGDPFHDVVYSAAIVKTEPVAVARFTPWFNDFARGVARKKNSSYAERDDWIADLTARLMLPVDRGPLLAKYRGLSGLNPWLAQTVYRDMLQCIAKENRSPGSVPDSVVDTTADGRDQTSATSESCECRRLIQRLIVAALKEFDERTRQVLVHRIVDGMKNKDVARVIGLSEGQTSRLWFGAVEKLGEVVRRKIAEASQERAASLQACLESTLGWRAGNPLDRFFSGLMNLEEAKT